MADKIVAEYTVKVDKALKDLDKLAKRVDKVDDERKKTQDGFKSMSDGLSSKFKKLGGTIAAAFAVDRIVEFGKEAVKLAAQAEGVERAFRRIGGSNSGQLLQGLRDATRGTVSDLQLMQRAVQASNFKIPLENLASLFKFAQARARETGESVDYLTNSIVLGIGRKSPLILDNLGISAVELRNRLKGVGVEASSVGDIAEIIGDIAEEELGKMGDQADTAADKIAQLSTNTENLKIALGKLITEESVQITTFFSNLSKALADDITELDRFKQSLQGDSGLTLLNKLTEETAKLKDLEAEATEKAGRVRDAEFNKINQAVDFQRRLVEAIRSELDARVDNSVEQEITIDLINKQTDAYRKLIQEQNKSVNSINELNKQLKTYKDDLKNAEIGSSEFFAIVDKITSKTKELNEAIAMTKLSDALKIDEDEEFEIPEIEGGIVGDDLEKLVFGEDGSERIEQILQNNLNEALENFDNEETAGAPDLEGIAEALNEAFTLWQDFFSAISQLQRQQTQFELSNLEAKLQAEEITREEYEEKRRNLLRKQAAQEKTNAIIQATINTALAVTAALNTQPFLPLGPISAAIAAASGAAQIAAISAQPIPQYEEGGFVTEHGEIKGRKHKQGGVTIEAEGGEFITSAKHASQNAEILRAINSGQWEKYKLENIVAPAINQIMEGGFEGLGKSAQLNGIKADLKDHNIIHSVDRLRQSQQDGFKFLARELKSKNQKRGGYRA